MSPSLEALTTLGFLVGGSMNQGAYWVDLPKGCSLDYKSLDPQMVNQGRISIGLGELIAWC